MCAVCVCVWCVCVCVWVCVGVCVGVCVCARACVLRHRRQVLWTVGWLSSRLPSCRLVHLQRYTGYITSNIRKK